MKRVLREASLITALLPVVTAVAFLLPCRASEPVPLAYTGYGAQGTVSGSLHVLHVDEDLYIFDTGLFMGTAGKNYPWPAGVPVGSVKAVFITHAHVDHIGRLPLLLREGYRGPVYMTEVTRDIARSTLPGNIHRADFGIERFYYSRNNEGKARIPVYLEGQGFDGKAVQEKNRVFVEARRSELERMGYYLQSAQRKTLQEELLRRLEEQVRILHPGERRTVGALDVEFIGTSHIPGSVMIAVSCAGRELMFSGDVGSDGSPLFKETPRLERRIDYLWVEGTYGSHRQMDFARERREFRQRVASLVGQGHRVVIPAFAIDRTQQVLYEVSRAMAEGLLPGDTPVKVYSRSANEITRLYRRYAGDRRVVERYFSHTMKGERFSMAGYSEPRVDWRSRDPLRLGHGEIGIMTSGMAEYAYARRAVEDYGGDDKTAFCFVSYQARRTPGWQMLQGKRQVTFSQGKRVEIRASAHQTEAFSGHADPAGMLKVFGGSQIGQVFLVHLDAANAEKLTRYYREALGVPVLAPRHGERIDLGQPAPRPAPPAGNPAERFLLEQPARSGSLTAGFGYAGELTVPR